MLLSVCLLGCLSVYLPAGLSVCVSVCYLVIDYRFFSFSCLLSQIKTYEIIQNLDKIYIVMELAGNGDMLQYINRVKRIPEERARRYYRQLFDAITYLHSINIAHRSAGTGLPLNSCHMRTHSFSFSHFLVLKIQRSVCLDGTDHELYILINTRQRTPSDRWRRSQGRIHTSAAVGRLNRTWVSGDINLIFDCYYYASVKDACENPVTKSTLCSLHIFFTLLSILNTETWSVRIFYWTMTWISKSPTLDSLCATLTGRCWSISAARWPTAAQRFSMLRWVDTVASAGYRGLSRNP